MLQTRSFFFFQTEVPCRCTGRDCPPPAGDAEDGRLTRSSFCMHVCTERGRKVKLHRDANLCWCMCPLILGLSIVFLVYRHELLCCTFVGLTLQLVSLPVASVRRQAMATEQPYSPEKFDQGDDLATARPQAMFWVCILKCYPESCPLVWHGKSQPEPRRLQPGACRQFHSSHTGSDQSHTTLLGCISWGGFLKVDKVWEIGCWRASLDPSNQSGPGQSFPSFRAWTPVWPLGLQ